MITSFSYDTAFLVKYLINERIKFLISEVENEVKEEGALTIFSKDRHNDS